jgi:predicted Asp-tRNA(Asn)/Glu-tRNA(Gln) amidotransferase subunit C
MSKMENFSNHIVTNEERAEINREAKKLLNDFAAKLNKIKTKESHFENGEGCRDEGEAWKTEENFRDVILTNAPFAEEGSIVAEKGSWKK